MTEAKFRGRFVPALKPHCLIEYMASMHKQGVPDIYILHEGHSYWLELKFVDDMPKRDTSNVLKKHNFTGPQLSFLRRVDDNGGKGRGVIGFRDQGTWKCLVAGRERIGDDGTLTLAEFNSHEHLVMDKDFGPRFLDHLRRS